MKMHCIHDVRCRLFVILFVLCFASQAIAQGSYSSRQVSGQVPGGYETKYLVYTPSGYPQAGTDYPLLVSLHGGSAIGDDISMLTETPHQTPAMLISNNRWYDHPFVVVSPQLKRDFSYTNYNDQNWPPEVIDEVVEHIKATYNIDESKVYLTGISLGGAGSWNYAAAYPQKVTAIVPISGKTPVGEACKFKDIPVWAFHGSNDALVPPSWSEQMVNAIRICPGKIYEPHLNLLYSMEHEGWNQVYDLTNGYDIFNWMLKFTKGNNSNHTPFVSTGIDREMELRTGPIYLTSEYFDSDGSGAISNVAWTKVSGPAITMANTNERTLRLTPALGTFVFQLAVTDANGSTSTDQVQLKITNPSVTPEVTSLTLTNGNGSVVYGVISDDLVIDLNSINPDEFNVRAAVNGSAGFVRFSVNSDQNTRMHFAGSNYYLKDASKDWTILPGTYLVCGVAGNTVGGVRQEGTSLCHQITFTDEPAGIAKYYSMPSSNIALTSSWKSNRNGTGSSPANFTAPNQWFYVQNTVNLSSPLALDAANRLTVESGGRINVSAELSASLYILDGATMNVNTAADVSIPEFIGPSSTYIYGDAVTIIPSFGGNVRPYGNLVINSTTNATKRLAAGQTHVRGDITVQSTVTLIRDNNNTDLYLKGNAYFNGPPSLTNGFSMRCTGYSNQYINLNGGTTYAFRNFIVEAEAGGGTVAKFVSPTTATIRVTGGSTGLIIKNKGFLYLNGNTLSLESGNLNSGGETGELHAGNGTFIVNYSGGSPLLNLNLHPEGNKLKALEVLNTGSSAAGLSVLDPLYITERLELGAGKLTTNSNVTLVSTPTSTAYVGTISGTPSVVGNINVERSIPAGSVYRYLSFPVTGANVANLITHLPITGPFTGASSGSTVPSLYYYNEASATDWVPYPSSGGSASGSSLVIGRGYSAYMWNGGSPEHVTLSGTLHTGNFNFAVNPGVNLLPANPTADPNLGWTLLGNPYACPIQWSPPTAGGAAWEGSNISNTVYVRVQDNGTDKFRFSNGTTGNFTGTIASGQAVWVRSIGASPSLTVKEAAKVEQTNVQFYRTGTGEGNVLHLNLRQNNLDDDTYIEFTRTGSPKFDQQRDAAKMKNSFFNVSVLSSDSVGTAIKSLCDTVCSQEISLGVEINEPGNYTLSADGSAFDNFAHVYIFDTYVNKTTKLAEGGEYNFEVNSDERSFNVKRFRLLIDKDASPRPVISYNNGVLVSSITGSLQWRLNGEIIPGATSSELVPRSDGDYSVQVQSKGCAKISAPYSFRITNTEDPLASEITLYPNPAVNVLHVAGLKGDNEFNITSLSGAIIESGVVVPESNGEGTIRLRSLSSGLYFLRLNGERGELQFKFSVR